MNTDTPSAGTDTVCPASLENCSSSQWQRVMHLGYLFGRHARHDQGNIHCTLSMLQSVQRMSQTDPSMDLPPEYAPEMLPDKIELATRQIVSMAHDMVLLTHAGSSCAYQPVATATLMEVLEQGLAGGDEASDAVMRLIEQAGEARLVVLGDMLPAAMGACYYQWARELHSATRAADARIHQRANQVDLVVPADDVESLAAVARRLVRGDNAMPELLERPTSLTAAEMALWLARHIILVHGGTFSIDPNDPDLAIRISLPTLA
ncbi:MAG: hypothetical protein IT440_08370 [Phycisphaeraceae bacterium]|nr:hypothetical protein [Phycisphaeraceae bacterium]